MRNAFTRSKRIAVLAVPAIAAALLAACGSSPIEPTARPSVRQVSTLDTPPVDTTAKGPTMPWY